MSRKSLLEERAPIAVLLSSDFACYVLPAINGKSACWDSNPRDCDGLEKWGELLGVFKSIPEKMIYWTYLETTPFFKLGK